MEYRHHTILLSVCWGLVMGILSFRSEGEGQPVRFLAHHGTSAGMIWKAKQAVWMVRAFLTPAILLALVAIRDSVLLTYPGNLIERHIWVTLLSYGCGQLSAMLLRRAILAAITGATAAAVLFLWLELMRSLQLPQWWSLGIPAMTPLLATCLFARPWLLDGSTWSQKVRLAAVLIGLPLSTCVIVAVYRVVEVERIEPSLRREQAFQLPWQYQYETGSLTTAQSSTDLSARPRLLAIAIADVPVDRRPIATSGSASPRLSEREQKLADQVTGAFLNNSTLIHESLVPPTLPPTDDPIGLRGAKILYTDRDPLFPVNSFERLSDLLLARARDHLQRNEQEPAFDVCLAHLSLCRAMARGPFKPCWQAGADRERRVLELMVEWANCQRVTFAEIHGAIKEMEARLRQFPTPGSAIIDELTEAKRVSIVDNYTKFHGATIGWQRVWLQLPWETIRRDQLWEMEALLHRSHLSYLANRFSFGPGSASRMNYTVSVVADENVAPVGKDYLQPLAALQATTWGAEVALSEDRSGIVRDRFTAVNAALTRMGIIAYRKQHRKMPADLDALFGIVRQWNFQDPWSGGRLDYRANCLVSQGNAPSVLDTNSEKADAVARRPPEASRFVFPIPAVLVGSNEESSTPTRSKTE